MSEISNCCHYFLSNPCICRPIKCLILLVLLFSTVAQEWHIVSLLGDVTSPTTVAHYVSMTCSDNREALTAEPTAHSVQKQAFRVHHWASREASFRHCSGWGTETFPLSSVICAAVLFSIKSSWFIFANVAFIIKKYFARWSFTGAVVVVSCYLTTAMYYNYDQRPSPSVDWW